jgi:hypothetical protein
LTLLKDFEDMSGESWRKTSDGKAVLSWLESGLVLRFHSFEDEVSALVSQQKSGEEVAEVELPAGLVGLFIAETGWNLSHFKEAFALKSANIQNREGASCVCFQSVDMAKLTAAKMWVTNFIITGGQCRLLRSKCGQTNRRYRRQAMKCADGNQRAIEKAAPRII